ncbi:hypothetical protein CcI156_17090 [Frankia sp. CcI156]|uniref:hypothetical protein n=1 Tax=Frankia TaxID=1854 RepID=UPI0003D03415|nr:MULTISPECIES: hypothetical protein [Frankia]ETA00998.1 hypothetical protein CcI6DRAFT_03537 [Frankia sp. CcI6]EYT91442.1 hypothetical protein ThrDRAFT_02871 [Frankia casuarinae]OHV52493.1 hypothetical protein CgIS1_17045 [Frankia sp. CgIS1]ONH23963.1 hypothetical protein CcI156_17090 [Frankia sp. CcI156]
MNGTDRPESDKGSGLDESFVARLELALTARIRAEHPGRNADLIGLVVGRTVELLAGSAAHNMRHPLADAVVYLLAHGLRDGRYHQVLADTRLDLPGLTRDVDAFNREVALLDRLHERHRAPGGRGDDGSAATTPREPGGPGG